MSFVSKIRFLIDVVIGFVVIVVPDSLTSTALQCTFLYKSSCLLFAYLLKDRCRAVLYDVVTGDKFEIAILTVIICNMVMMMIQHYGQSAQVSSILNIL